MTRYFLDSYALFEIAEGSKAYEPYKKDTVLRTTKLNLMEFHYGLLMKKGKEQADKYYDTLRDLCVEIGDETIKTANAFRHENRKMKFSYIDCVGYVTAKSIGAVFLTGDNAFEGMENVEFVK